MVVGRRGKSIKRTNKGKVTKLKKNANLHNPTRRMSTRSTMQSKTLDETHNKQRENSSSFTRMATRSVTQSKSAEDKHDKEIINANGNNMSSNSSSCSVRLERSDSFDKLYASLLDPQTS